MNESVDIKSDFHKLAFGSSSCPLLLIDATTSRVLGANEALLAYLGISEDQALDIIFTDLIASEANRSWFRQYTQDVMAGRVLLHQIEYEIDLLPPDGHRRQSTLRIHTHNHPDLEHCLGVVLNEKVIESKVNPEHEWSQAQAISYQQLLESIGNGFISLDNQGRVVFNNDSAEKVLGLEKGALNGAVLMDCFPAIDREPLAEALEKGLHEDQSLSVLTPVNIHNEIRHLEVGIHHYEKGAVVLLRDKSDRVRREQEIATLNATMAVSQELLRRKNDELNESLEKLEEMNTQLAQADQMKSEFLANTSHELRTPLNSIIGFLQLVTEDLCENREEELDYLRNAHTSAEHLLSLITDVLDIAKIEAGKMTLLTVDVDIDTLFQDVACLTGIQAQRKGLGFLFEWRGEEPYHARADFNKTKQVLVNLVGNSIKFTHEGYVCAWAKPDPDHSDMMLFCVEDSGIGVAKDFQGQIFEKFTQADATSTRKYQGTGLGLAICRNLVEMMGGSIWLQSEGEGQGAKMFFLLPMGNPKGQAMDPDGKAEGEGADLLPRTF